MFGVAADLERVEFFQNRQGKREPVFVKLENGRVVMQQNAGVQHVNTCKRGRSTAGFRLGFLSGEGHDVLGLVRC